MTKIAFTSHKQSDSTHRISDGVESSYFVWPDDLSSDEVVMAYASGYDANDGDEDFVVTAYNLDDNSVSFRCKVEQ